jgi:hypothetical protein
MKREQNPKKPCPPSSVVKATTTNKTNERKSMNNQFDELTKSLAQSVTRRAALKKFGLGLAGMALGCFGLASRARAGGNRGHCLVTLTGPTSGYLSGWCGDCTGNGSSALSSECAFGTPALLKKVCVVKDNFSWNVSSIRCGLQ